jgi:DNA-binding PucR family transcriptional regulator
VASLEQTQNLIGPLTRDPVFASELLDGVLSEVPALGRDPEVRAIALAMVSSSLDSFAIALEHEVPVEEIEAPWLALKYARRLAWEGVTVDEIMRGFRLGHEFLFGRLAPVVAAQGAENPEAIGLMTRAAVLSFRVVDVLCTAVAAEFATERDSIMRGALARRNGLIRSILDGDPADVHSAERTLGYPLAGRHLATLLWRFSAQHEQPTASLEHVAERLAAALGAGRPLVMHEGPELIACWLSGVADSADWSVVDGALPPDCRLACGGLGTGVSGFRETRRQADRARAVALAQISSGDTRARVVRYEEVALVSLLIADPLAARAFVREELGALARGDDLGATLRRTLLVLLRTGGQQEASEELFVHRNTIAQRVRKAEELLGRPLRVRRPETEAALLVSEWTGPGEPG